MSWVNLIYQLLVNLPTIIKTVNDMIFAIEESNRKKKREQAQVDAQKEYDAVFANPNSTIEEKAKANAKLINSGKP